METEKRVLKFLHIPLLVLTNTVSVTLVCLLNRRFTGDFPYRVEHHRTVTAVIVQVLATLFAAAQVYIFCTLINFATRLQSVQRFVQAKSLKILAALSAAQIDWSLRWYATVGTALFYFIGPLLGAVWAGALTPLFDESPQQDGTIQTPLYTGSFDPSFTLLPGGTIYLNCPSTKWTESLTIGKCSAISYITSLMSSAQGATTNSNTTRISPKIDDPAWSYTNRSYGAGASQGLFFPTNDMNHTYTAYSYDEPGYLSQVTCGFNESSNLTIQQMDNVQKSHLVIWQLDGSLPNTQASDTSSYTLTTAATDWYDEVLGWSAAAADGRNMLAVATYTGTTGAVYGGSAKPDHWYSAWNTMQCSIDFSPTLFNVLVNMTTSRIIVNPKDSCPDFEPTGSLKTVVMANLDLVSRMSSNIGVSTLGNALGTNAAAVTANNPNMSSNETLVRAAENMITALVDDLLGAEASQQMVFNSGSQGTMVQKDFNAIQLGSPQFIYISLGINIALVLLVLAETVRTRAWRHLPAFNFTNLQSVMAAAMLSSSHKNLSYGDEDDSIETAARSLKHARIRWSHNDNDDTVMLVKLPGDLSDGEALQKTTPMSSSTSLGETATIPAAHTRDSSSENQEPLLFTTERRPSLGGVHAEP